MWTLVVLCSCAVKIISCSFFAKIPHRANRVIKMHSLCSRFFAPIFEKIVNAAPAVFFSLHTGLNSKGYETKRSNWLSMCEHIHLEISSKRKKKIQTVEKVPSIDYWTQDASETSTTPWQFDLWYTQLLSIRTVLSLC